ncbi:hypothetical protein ACQZV8_18930 [Magnetococcales bacterium HHB-1]
MKITRFEMISEEMLLKQLKEVRLRGFNQRALYRQSEITLQRAVDPEQLFPAQRYVLKEDFNRIKDLYLFFQQQKLDIFALEGGLYFWCCYDDAPEVEEGPIPLLPPVVEISKEKINPRLLLINDGMHRVYTAKQLGKKINIIQIDHVPEETPYYAYPLEKGWSEVQELDALPDNFVKKTYRDPENYKALFRDFNAIFPGVQKQRKRSNPKTLRA